MVLPLTNTEIFPDYALLPAGAVTLASESVVIPVDNFIACDTDELAADGNGGELLRSILLSAQAAQNARPVADRPTRSIVAQQQGVTDAGVDAVTGVPLATNVLQVTTTFNVGSVDGGSIALEPTV